MTCLCPSTGSRCCLRTWPATSNFVPRLISRRRLQIRTATIWRPIANGQGAARVWSHRHAPICHEIQVPAAQSSLGPPSLIDDVVTPESRLTWNIETYDFFTTRVRARGVGVDRLASQSSISPLGMAVLQVLKLYER